MRITPTMAQDAYKATGLTPERGLFYQDGLACAIGVILVYNHKNPAPIEIDDEGREIDTEECPEPWFKIAAAFFDTSQHYLEGFAEGFDGIARREVDDDYKDGWFDGAAVAYEVFPAPSDVQE